MSGIFKDFLRARERSGMDEGDRAVLDALPVDVRTVPARQVVIRSGEPVSVSTHLIDGFMCRYMDDNDGFRQLVALHIPGDFVDLHGYPLGKLDHDVATLSPCKMALVPHGRLDTIMEERPRIARSLWYSTLLDAAMHREWVFRLGRLGAAPRIAHFLAETELRLRAVGRSDEGRFAFPLTQADIGEACGLTPVHVNRMLRTLREDDIVRIDRGMVEVLDFRRLWKLAEFDPDYLFIEKSVARCEPMQSMRMEG